MSKKDAPAFFPRIDEDQVGEGINNYDLIKKEVYIDDCYRVGEMSFDRPPEYIVDIGANVGWFSLLAAEKFPKAEIYSYELMDKYYAACHSNLKQHENVHVYNKAVIGKNKITAICEPTMDNIGACKAIYAGSGSYISEGHAQFGDWVTPEMQEKFIDMSEMPVDQISLEEIILENNIDYIDILKVDIEGGEYEVLNHVLELNLDKKILNLVMELHGVNSPECPILVEELRNRFDSCVLRGDKIPVWPYEEHKKTHSLVICKNNRQNFRKEEEMSNFARAMETKILERKKR